MLHAILTVSLALQILAGILSVRFLRETGWWKPWSLIAATALFLGIFTGRSLYHLYAGERFPSSDLHPEILVLLVSALLFAGVVLLGATCADICQRLLSRTEREARLRVIFDNVLAGLITIDETGIIEDFNKAAETIFGYWAEEVIGHDVNILMPEPDKSAHESYLHAYLNSGEAKIIGSGREVWGRHKNGRRIPLYLGIGEVTVGDRRTFVGMLHDLSERKAAEDLNLRLGRILDDSLNEILVFDAATYNFIQVNEGARQNLGYGVKDLTALKPWNLMPAYTKEGFLKEVGPLLEGEEKRLIFETELLRKDASLYPVEMHLQLFDNEEPPVFAAIIVDISERKNNERKFANLRKFLEENISRLNEVNAELEAFSYSVSHDLRAPLRGIDGFSALLMEDYGDRLDDEGKGYLDRIRSGTQRMGDLIDDLLQLSRVNRQEMAPQTIDLGKLSRDIFATLRHGDPERRVDVAIDGDITVKADARLMRIAMENLIGNAWKFTAKATVPKIEIGVSAAKDGQTVFVRDNGAGFDMGRADKLFGAFQRFHNSTDFPGSGVGLATVKRIIGRHGGRVWARSEPNKGATFYFSISHAAEERNEEDPAS